MTTSVSGKRLSYNAEQNSGQREEDGVIEWEIHDEGRE